jgi:hypothetical protein
MTPIDSVVLILLGLSILAFSRSAQRRATEARSAEKSSAVNAMIARMPRSAEIARASTSDAFGVQLDYSDESLHLLDDALTLHWHTKLFPFGVPAPMIEPSPVIELTDSESHEQESIAAVTSTEPPDRVIDDPLIVLGAYVGEVLTKQHSGIWRFDALKHPLPFIYFALEDLPASPFDMVRRKLDDPQVFDLFSAFERLVSELESHRVPHEASFASTLEEPREFEEPSASISPVQEPPME